MNYKVLKSRLIEAALVTILGLCVQVQAKETFPWPADYGPLKELYLTVESGTFDFDYCSEGFDRLSQKNDFKWAKASSKELEQISEADAAEFVKRSFEVRLKLRNFAASLEEKQKEASESVDKCLHVVRSLMRIIRGAEDIIGEWGVQQTVKRLQADEINMGYNEVHVDGYENSSTVKHRYDFLRSNPERLTLRQLERRRHEMKDPDNLSKYSKDTGFVVESFVNFPFQPPSTDYARKSRIPFTLINDRAANQVDFRSGDIILVRGATSVSSSIARIGDTNLDFSHIVLVYKDKRECRDGCTIEALIENGVKTYSLKDHITSSAGIIRAQLYRYHDAKVAHQAAKKMYDLVKAQEEEYERGLTDEKTIRYDFAFDLHNHDELFCSEVATMGYEDFGVHIPTFPSSFAGANKKFMKSLGVEHEVTFAPGDMELESQFELVAEWRDFSRVGLINRYDAVIDALYALMERDESPYSFHSTELSRGIADVAMSLRTKGTWTSILGLTPLGKIWDTLGFRSLLLPSLLRHALTDFFPEYMSKSAIETVIQLEFMSKKLNRKAQLLDAQILEEQQRVSTYEEIYSQTLDEVKSDFAKFRQCRDSDFAHYFHPTTYRSTCQ